MPNNSDIKLNSLFDYFKDMHSIEHDDVNDSREELVVQNFNSDALNIEVTDDEIMNCIKKFRWPEIDEIINDYIKISCSILLPIYLRLFNMIFDTGNIP